MRIAIDGRILTLPVETGLYSGANLLIHLLKKGVRHQFILISDHPISKEWSNFPNLEIVLLKPGAGSMPLSVIWYDFRLPALMKKRHVDIFLGLSGFISLRSPVKQLLWLQDALEAGKNRGALGWRGLGYQKRLKAMVKNAKVVCVPAVGLLGISNGKTGNETEEGIQKTRSDKFFILPVAINPLMDTPPKEKGIENPPVSEALTSLLNSKMPFFLCFAGWQTTEDALELLLAFSAFKKRMQSGLKLVLAGEAPRGKIFREKLGTYRYREDVWVLKDLPFHQADFLLRAAYALIHLPARPQLDWIFKAMQCRVPVITKPLIPFMGLCGDHVLYCTETPGESLAQHMMQIYKDEGMRSRLIKKSSDQCSLMDPEKVAGEILLLAEES